MRIQDASVTDFLARVKEIDEQRNREDELRHRELERQIDDLNKSPRRSQYNSVFANSASSYFQSSSLGFEKEKESSRNFGSSVDLNINDSRYNELKVRSSTFNNQLFEPLGSNWNSSISADGANTPVKKMVSISIQTDSEPIVASREKKQAPKISIKPAHLSSQSSNLSSPTLESHSFPSSVATSFFSSAVLDPEEHSFSTQEHLGAKSKPSKAASIFKETDTSSSISTSQKQSSSPPDTLSKSSIKPFDFDDSPRLKSNAFTKLSARSSPPSPKKSSLKGKVPKPSTPVTFKSDLIELIHPVAREEENEKPKEITKKKPRAVSPSKVKAKKKSLNIGSETDPLQEKETRQIEVGPEVPPKSKIKKIVKKPSKNNPLEIDDDSFSDSVAKLVGKSKAARLLSSTRQASPAKSYRSFGDMVQEMEIQENSPKLKGKTKTRTPRTPSPMKSSQLNIDEIPIGEHPSRSGSPKKTNWFNSAMDKSKQELTPERDSRTSPRRANWFESALQKSSTPPKQSADYIPRPDYYNALSASKAAKAPPLKTEVNSSLGEKTFDLHNRGRYLSSNSPSSRPNHQQEIKRLNEESPTKHKASWLDSAIRNTPRSHRDPEPTEIKIKPSKPSKKSALALKFQESVKSADDEYLSLKNSLRASAKEKESMSVQKQEEAHAFASINLKRAKETSSREEIKRAEENEAEALRQLTRLKNATPITKRTIQETPEALAHLSKLHSGSPIMKPREEDTEVFKRLNQLNRAKPIEKPPRPTPEALAKLSTLNKSAPISKAEQEVPEALSKLNKLRPPPPPKKLSNDLPEAIKQLQKLKINHTGMSESGNKIEEPSKSSNNPVALPGLSAFNSSVLSTLSNKSSSQGVQLPFAPVNSPLLRKTSSFSSRDLAADQETPEQLTVTKLRSKGPKRRLPSGINETALASTEREVVKKIPPPIRVSSRKVSQKLDL